MIDRKSFIADKDLFSLGIPWSLMSRQHKEPGHQQLCYWSCHSSIFQFQRHPLNQHSMSEQNGQHFAENIFKGIFLEKKSLGSGHTSLMFVSKGLSTCSGNGLAWNRHQANTWINYDPVHCHIYMFSLQWVRITRYVDMELIACQLCHLWHTVTWDPGHGLIIIAYISQLDTIIIHVKNTPHPTLRHISSQHCT